MSIGIILSVARNVEQLEGSQLQKVEAEVEETAAVKE
jgi:hypothetical protein